MKRKKGHIDPQNLAKYSYNTVMSWGDSLLNGVAIG
jgi:hypothetical protein